MTDAFAGETGYDWTKINDPGPGTKRYAEDEEFTFSAEGHEERMTAYNQDTEIPAQARSIRVRREAEKLADDQENEGRRLVARRYSDIDFKRTDWLWSNRIPLGEITMIVGRGSVGKSTMLAKIAAAVTTGTLDGDFFGQPQDVLYIANEDDTARTVGPRLWAAGADTSRVHEITLNVEGSIDLTRDTARIIEYAKSVNARVIMFDPLSSNLGSSKKNDQGQMRNVFQAIQRMATENNLSIIGLGHTRKGQSKDLVEALMGSSEQANVCRSVIGIAADDEEDDKYIMSQEKSNLASMAITSYSYKMETVDFKLDEGVYGKTNRIAQFEETSKRVTDIIENDNTNGASGHARTWLRDFLEQQGTTAKSEVVKEAAKERISVRTLERAAGSICKREGVGRNMFWSLKEGNSR